MLENGEESDAPRPRRVLQEGDNYDGFDPQMVFDKEVPKGALLIEIFRANNAAYPKKLNNGIAPPPEFSRPEIARILSSLSAATRSSATGYR